MKAKVIHCRVTEDQHAAISEAARNAGKSLTEYVIRAALAEQKAA